MAKKSKKAETQKIEIVTYKGFDKDLKCRGFQYEIGGTYDNGGKPVERCGEGAFHGCEHPLDVLNYYSANDGSRYAEIIQSGDIVKGDGPDSDTKVASAKITIKMELSLGDLGKRAVAWVAGMAKKQGNGQYAAGSGGHASAAGSGGHASAAGSGGHASAAGSGGHASAAGSGGHASAAGKNAIASAAGKNAIASALGINSTAKAGAGGAISLAAYDNDWNLVAVRSSLVGENGIKAGKTYRLLVTGEFEEVTA